MKGPTKKLKNMAARYNKVKQQFEFEVRAYIWGVTPMDADEFWEHLESFTKELRRRFHYVNNDAFRSGAHNTIISLKQTDPDPLAGWHVAASFIAAYRHMGDTLSNICWKMPDVDKGEDGYGDWMDSLPLAGRAVFDGIMNGDFATYKQVTQAVKKHCLKLDASLIMDGENYVKSKFEEELVKHAAYNFAADLAGE
jgi:hypothetical protein